MASVIWGTEWPATVHRQQLELKQEHIPILVFKKKNSGK